MTTKNMNSNKTESIKSNRSRNLRVREVVAIVGISRPTIYRLMERFKFPKRVKISQGLVGWRTEDISEYLDIGPEGWYEKYGKNYEQELIGEGS